MKRLFLIFLVAIAANAQQNALMLPWTPQQFTNTNGTVLAGCGKTAVLNEIRNPNYAGFKTDAVRTAFKAHKCL